MRARTFRPVFDRLDTRLVLDGGGAATITGGAVGTSVLAIMTTGDQSSTTDVSSLVDWYLPGSPQDASDTTIDLVASTS